MSCGDDSSAISNEEFLAGRTAEGKNWRITLIEVELGSIDPFPCVADNNITYFPNGRYEVNEGTTKCDPLDPPAYLGSWILDDRTLTITLDDSVRVWNLDIITSNRQEISSQFSDGERIYILEPR
jgi:hypothetical protein